MRKLLLAVSLCAALLIPAAAASADAGTTMATCGQSHPENDAIPLLLDWYPAENSWHVRVNWACGGSATYLVEVQESTDGGAHWNDRSTQEAQDIFRYHHWYTSSPLCGGGAGCTQTYVYLDSDCASGEMYRATVWDYNDRRYTKALSGGCS